MAKDPKKILSELVDKEYKMKNNQGAKEYKMKKLELKQLIKEIVQEIKVNDTPFADTLADYAMEKFGLPTPEKLTPEEKAGNYELRSKYVKWPHVKIIAKFKNKQGIFYHVSDPKTIASGGSWLAYPKDLHPIRS